MEFAEFMEPKIVDKLARKLIGIRIRTTLATDRPAELWRLFKPRVKEITGRSDDSFYSVQIFEKSFKFEDLTPETAFEKWAAVEVGSFDNVPEGTETLSLTGGKYAVFIHKGTPADFPRTAAYIYGSWLPESGYELDEREHFEVMGPKYLPNDPNAEEEIWVPVKG